MLRLNNKDYTVEELERLIMLISNVVFGSSHDIIGDVDNTEVEEIRELVKGSQFTKFEKGRHKSIL